MAKCFSDNTTLYTGVIMFSENVKPGDSVLFIDREAARTLVKLVLKSIEFTGHGQFIRVDAIIGPDSGPIHEFRVNPHRQISFPDRVRGTDIGCVEFYDPEVEYGICTVPIVIHASDGVSIHVDHVETDAMTSND